MENLDVNIKESLKNATEGDLEELSSNEAEKELLNNEIGIDENFVWFDNEMAELIYDILQIKVVRVTLR